MAEPFGNPTRGGYVTDFVRSLPPEIINLLFVEIFAASAWPQQMFYGRTGRVATLEGRIQFVQTMLANPTKEQDQAAAVALAKSAFLRGWLGRENENYQSLPIDEEVDDAVVTDEEAETSGPAGFTTGAPAVASLSFSTVDIDISQNTTGLDESLGFNTETGQHTVATPGLTGATGVLGNFNIETQMYNNFGPGVGGPTGNGPSPTGVSEAGSPGQAAGAGGQAP